MEYKYINELKWTELVKKPDWYLVIRPEYEKLKKQAEENGENQQLKEEVYEFFEKHLAQGGIALGDKGNNWDSERKPIDTIIIHHTKNSPGITKERLSAMILMRLYASYYAKPTDKEDESIVGKPIYSGHFRNGQQVFYPYHWLVRKEGSLERLLFDNETGWQSGNWEINCRSVAIVLDNNYEESYPSAIELSAIANLIKSQYNSVPKNRIFGHQEVKPNTTCPSKFFLSKDGQKGWKEDLLNLI